MAVVWARIKAVDRTRDAAHMLTAGVRRGVTVTSRRAICGRSPSGEWIVIEAPDPDQRCRRCLAVAASRGFEVTT